MAKYRRRIKNQYYRYTVLLLCISLLMISAIIIFNINYTFSIESRSKNILAGAISWQARSRGVIATQVRQSSRLKNAQTKFAIDTRNVDTLILGSSTVMGIRDYMFPSDRVVFNGAKNSNHLWRTISEAKYYIKRSNNLKWILIGFDWELGYPYQKSSIINFKPDNGCNEDNSENTEDPNLWRKIKDAASTQRVKIVLSNLKSDLLNPDDSYKCPKENNLGKDIFNPPFPRTCYGFRYDGSATFSNYNGLKEGSWHALLKKLNKYTYWFKFYKGVLNEKYLAELVKIDQTLKSRGGRLIILIPPMMPQAVSTLEEGDVGIYMKKTLERLSIFTGKNSLAVFNASRSEQFGCDFGEFLDPHHAFDTCYSKIFRAMTPLLAKSRCMVSTIKRPFLTNKLP